MEKYIISIDQGTTSTRAILFTFDGKIKATSSRSLPCYYPYSGAVEQDPLEIIVSVNDTIHELMIKENLTSEQILSIGITNQRETTIVWEKETGKPVHNALVWQSKQSQAICESLKDKEEFIRSKTGLILNPYFSASKIRYILDNIENGQERAERGELLFGTVDTWVLYRLTKGKSFATDYSNASRTLLFNIFEKKWDEDLLKLFNIPSSMLPEVKESSCIFGYCDIGSESNLVPIAGILGDQQSSLFGQTCFTKGDIKNTYGTGCFLLMNIGDTPKLYDKGLLTTLAWGIDGKVTYAVEGSVLIGGASIQWLRDELRIIEKSSDSEAIAYNTSNDDVYVVPAFVGLGTPYWDNNCRGAIFGLTRNSSRDVITKATLESIAYQSKDVMEVMKKETKYKFNSLSVDGGASNNNYLLQFQSDILNLRIRKSEISETTALGVFYLCALTLKLFNNLEEIKKAHKVSCIFDSKMDRETRNKKYKKWKLAVSSARKFI